MLLNLNIVKEITKNIYLYFSPEFFVQNCNMLIHTFIFLTK